MFINDVHRKEEIRTLAKHDLKSFGLKYRPKKSRQHVQETKTRKLFKQPLNSLPMETVTLPSGQQLVVPKLVHELCSYIITKVDTEGLFRKGGAKSRQNEIKLSLDAGCYLGEDHHEIDVASVLKTFFRELPEPLIPYSYHELFLRCMLSPDNQRVTVLLSCLLLPTEHLNTVTYFMQFLNRVAQYNHFNKMDAYNLAIVMGPTLLPEEEKLNHNATHRLAKTCELFKLLIENAEHIGVLSESIIERIAVTNSTVSLNVDEDTLSIKKKKKRRSSSLTRMLSGLKKIVTNKSDDTSQPLTPDILLTPCITRSSKKRKMEIAGLSTKKRRDILCNMPQKSLLNTPFTPSRTPVNVHPKGKNYVSPEICQKSTSKTTSTKEKKPIWKSNKKQDDTTSQKSSRLSLGSHSMLQRRCSAVSSAMGFKKKKTRSSCVGTLNEDTDKVIEKDPQTDNRINDLSEELIKHKDVESLEAESGYVKIPVEEYEEIKSRVSAIERRISIELDMAQIESVQGMDDGFNNVAMAYEETMQAEPMSSTTDQLAKRLSRELKIRRSSESKVFRSPSARKIGSLRRRSKEMQNRTRLSRNQSWHVSGMDSPRSKLQRGKPNTVLSGLPQPSPAKIENITVQSDPNTSSAMMRRVTRSSSFHGEGLFSPASFHQSSSSYQSTTSYQSSNSYVSQNSNGSSTHWTSAEGFFKTPNISNGGSENCRASIAKLRTQNAGMVLAKARLFDNLESSDASANQVMDVALPRVKSAKIGAPRNSENRQSYRVRTLKIDDRMKGKKTMSPRKRLCKNPNTTKSQRLQLARAVQNTSGNNDKTTLRDYNRLESVMASPRTTTPRNVPQIKKSLNTKSPRRVCRTPNTTDNKQTPLKVMASAKRQLY